MADDELRAALDEALAIARKKCPTGEAADVAVDAVTDAILYAHKRFDPASGDWRHYCRRCVSLFMSRALLNFRRNEKARPRVSPWPEDAPELPARSLPAAGEVPMSSELRDLEPDLRDAVRLHLIDGYTLQECGLLMGLSAATVRERLHEAARELSPGSRPRPRAKNEKRLCKGRQRGGRVTTTEDASEPITR